MTIKMWKNYNQKKKKMKLRKQNRWGGEDDGVEGERDMSTREER